MIRSRSPAMDRQRWKNSDNDEQAGHSKRHIPVSNTKRYMQRCKDRGELPEVRVLRMVITLDRAALAKSEVKIGLKPLARFSCPDVSSTSPFVQCSKSKIAFLNRVSGLCTYGGQDPPSQPAGSQRTDL